MRDRSIGGAVACLLILMPALVAAQGDRSEAVIAAMISEGAPPEQARCVVEKLGTEAERIFTAADQDLTEADIQLLTTALETCAATGAGN